MYLRFIPLFLMAFILFGCPSDPVIPSDDDTVDPIDTTGNPVDTVVVPPDSVYNPSEFIESMRKMYNSGKYTGFMYVSDVYYLPDGSFFPTVEYVDTVAINLPSPINPDIVKYLSPQEKCVDWSCITKDDWFIVLEKGGDYRDNGLIEKIPWGEPGRYRVFTVQENRHLHPYKRDENEKTFMEGVLFQKQQPQWLYFHGVTWHGTTYSKVNGYDGKTYKGGRPHVIPDNSNHIVYDFCEFRNFLQGGIRMRGDFNGVQRCLFYDPVIMAGPKDRGGVGIAAGGGNISEECFVIECEFVNLGDSFGAQWDDSNLGWINGARFISIDSWNDLPLRQADRGDGQPIITYCGENIADFKGGSNDPNNPVRVWHIRGERIWPADPTCGGTGSGGEAYVTHNNARHYDFRHIITRDISNGAFNFGSNPKWSHIDGVPQNIQWHNSLFAEFHDVQYRKRPGRDTLEPVTGIGVKANSDDFRFTNITVAGYTQRDISLKGKRDVQFDFNCNIFEPANNAIRNTPKSGEDYNECNQEYVAGVETYDLIYYDRRWTGPRKVVIPNIPYPRLRDNGNCDCGSAQQYKTSLGSAPAPSLPLWKNIEEDYYE